MKKKSVLLLLALSVTLVLGGCGKDEEEKKEPDSAFADPVIQVVTEEKVEPEMVVEEEVKVEEETREGMYRSELTNEWIDESIKDQRPIAAMVDNEKQPFPTTV